MWLDGYGDAVGLRVPAEKDKCIGAVGQVGYLERVVGAADAIAQGTVVLVFTDGDGVGVDGNVNVDAPFLEAAIDKEVVMGDVEGAVTVRIAEGIGVIEQPFFFKGLLVGVVAAAGVADVLHGGL